MEGEGKRIKAHTKGTQGQQHRVVSVWKAKFEALLTRVWVWLGLILFPLKAPPPHTHTHASGADGGGKGEVRDRSYP